MWAGDDIRLAFSIIRRLNLRQEICGCLQDLVAFFESQTMLGLASPIGIQKFRLRVQIVIRIEMQVSFKAFMYRRPGLPADLASSWPLHLEAPQQGGRVLAAQRCLPAISLHYWQGNLGCLCMHPHG